MEKHLAIRIKRIAGWTLSILVMVLAILITLTIGWRPVVGAKARRLTNRHFERTPERLARGKYLTEAVANCFDCHTDPPQKVPEPGVAPVFGREGAGRVMIQEGNLLVVAPNITPEIETGAGSWTDDQFARAIREGIGHDDRTLFPLMPYGSFRNLSEEDLASIIVYVRSLPPVYKTLPKRHIPFLLSRLINTAPEPVKKPVVVSDSDATSHGRYLTRIAECMACHTPTDDMRRPLPGMEFSGGRVFESFHVASANITPDASGISYYDESLFIRTLRTGSVGARHLHFPMPWWNFRHMTDEDLKAIFAYLRTVKPVHHRIDNSEEATVCKVCNGRHGGGIENDRDRSVAETQHPTVDVDRLNHR